ncbi:MAG: ATP-binding protein, partial [Gemmatimonadaceae bacterium]
VQIEQALVEILSNALDAMPDGGVLGVAAHGSLGGVAIEISDTGAGIPEHLLPSVCEPFFTTRQGGTGLGLATAKRYVEQNGGQLEIESGASRAAGRGTTVRVLLPAAGAPSPDAEPEPAGAARMP